MVDIYKPQSWHDQPLDTIFRVLQGSALGLTSNEAATRLDIYGLNTLVAPPKPSKIKRFLMQFHNILIYVLLASAAITMLLKLITDTVVIITVVIVNAIIGFIQEGKAESAIDAISHMLAQQTHVLRDGVRHRIQGALLVPGDIVFLETGDKVPADLRLIDAHGLQILESILTGESVSVDKNNLQLATDTALADQTCIAFSGTLVTSGQGEGIVIATGITAEIGRISSMLANIKILTTPLIVQMDKFSKLLTLVILVMATLLLIFSYYSDHYSFSEIFIIAVALSVAAIPEALPTILTITLAVGVKEMACHNAIVKRLPAIETLGSVSVICTDKTGTLTQNEMTVASIVSDKHFFTLEGVGYGPHGTLKLDSSVVSRTDHAILDEFARVAIFCNDASLHEEKGVWSTIGDPMEGALLSFANKIGFDVQQEFRRWKRTDTIPFDSKHRFMATLNHDQQHAFIFVKGAPENILKMCDMQRSIHGDIESLNREYWHKKSDHMASLGQRVLAFALKPLKYEHAILKNSDLHTGLILLGLTGMIDPPRTDAIESVAACHDAGINVKMITGDHALTAAAIGRQLGLENPNNILLGKDIELLDDQQLKKAVLNCNIFARTTPEHKLRLVIALQSNNMTIAMTGDGVNDAPALRRADVGIAMGMSGSEAAKEASELVLTDDRFSSIIVAVREGRRVYDNIKKVITWTLPTNGGEASTVIIAILFNMTLPITALQILWINLVTAVTLGISLAYEPAEDSSMLRPPRKRDEPLLSLSLAWQIIFTSVLFVIGTFSMFNYAIGQGYEIEVAHTIAVNTIVVMEIFYLFFVRNLYSTSLTWKAVLGTKPIWLTVIIVTTAQFAVTYVPFLQRTFSTAAVRVSDGFLILSVGVALFALTEGEKQVRLYIGSLKPKQC